MDVPHACAGNEPEEVEAKCSVITAALKLGTADDHSESLCSQCEVYPLQDMAWPLCAALESVRTLFEAHATSRAAQQWSMNAAAFERLLHPALALISGADAAELKALFVEATAARQDVGSGWDAPAAGQMTLWG